MGADGMPGSHVPIGPPIRIYVYPTSHYPHATCCMPSRCRNEYNAAHLLPAPRSCNSRLSTDIAQCNTCMLQVAQGATDPELLKKAERTLSKMEERLQALAKERERAAAQQKAELAAKAKEQQRAAAAARGRNKEEGSGGGFFGSMKSSLFGGSGGSKGTKTTTQADSKPGIDATPAPLSPSPSPASPLSPAVDDSSSSSSPAPDTSWGGFAARLALGMASSLKSDAERMMRLMEAEKEAKVGGV